MCCMNPTVSIGHSYQKRFQDRCFESSSWLGKHCPCAALWHHRYTPQTIAIQVTSSNPPQHSC
ncbi:Uncharacterised protein [Vibrio cholerae]|nr:Uncharacterised protein [Vibrio cholerae]CSI79349.1 Uncharacterised protein [Vibrio cholerae]